jgi:TetR/AcrR family transcriptional regulator, transcriptional repressor of bet genes
MENRAAHRRTRIEDIRRSELIEAAHRVFLNAGMKGLTTTRICQEAGMSQGILTYYFKSKDDLLFEMVRFSNGRLMHEVVTGLRNATTRWDRLEAIVLGNFPQEHYERNTANAWTSFYAAAITNERYARLQRLFYRRLRSNLASALGGVLPRSELDHFAKGFAAMIDGLWLRRGQDDDLTSDEAIRLVTEHAQRMLGEDKVGILQQTAARDAE